MPLLLAIESSPRGDYSVSRQLTAHFVETWRSAHPGSSVTERDLGKTTLPLGSAPPKKPPQRVSTAEVSDPLLTVEDVALRLNVSRDWVWDHSSRKTPRLPVIRMGDGALRYRASGIEAFIDERERLSALRRRA